MTDKDADRTEGPVPGQGPWWTSLGTWGAVALIVTGILAAAWVFLRPSDTSQELAQGYYQAAKVVAIGLVIAGSALLNRVRTRSAAAGEGYEPERD